MSPETICLPPIVDGASIDEWLIPSAFSPNHKDMIPDDWTVYVRSDKRVNYDIDTLKGHIGYYESMGRRELMVNAMPIANLLRDLLTELEADSDQ